MKPYSLRIVSIVLALVMIGWMAPSGPSSVCEASGRLRGVRSARSCQRRARKSARHRRKSGVIPCSSYIVSPYPAICPLWEIGQVGNEWLYYGEYFEQEWQCPHNPEPAYLQGDYPQAPVDCYAAGPGDCESAGGFAGGASKKSQLFPGRDDYVPLNHHPTSEMPPNRLPNVAWFTQEPVTIQLPASDGERHVVLFKVRVKAKVGLGHRRTLFYGFETDKPTPATSIPVKYLDNGGNESTTTKSYVVRGTHLGHQYVIFLKKDSP